MLQIWNLLTGILGEQIVKLVFLLFLLSIIIAYMRYIANKKPTSYKIRQCLYVFALAYVLILLQPFFAARVHVIEYGILGYLALKDFRRKDTRIFKNIMRVLCFVALISLLDEGFQWILPYRFFEMQDILTNMAGGFLGVIQYSIYRNHMV